MGKLRFIKDYKGDEGLRKSFNALANNIFGIDFEEWYQKGFWGSHYIPFSYANGDQVIANVSVNILHLMIDGETRKAVQIGTVMTHPDYRNKGLSAALMHKVLQEYEKKSDFIYLFANQSVIDFYPKFGFEAVEEYEYSMEFRSNETPSVSVPKLDVKNVNDLHFIQQFAFERIPLSQKFSTDNAIGIFMFYCLNVFPDDIYFLEKENVIVLFKKEHDHLHIFDIVSKNEFNIQQVLRKITDDSIRKIVFHYTPDYPNIQVERKKYSGSDVLFVKSTSQHRFPLQIKHPLTSQA
ncbi:GNAT family N-acetyltransferase [Bacillus sp. FJAT-49732]|uniref:GNAT family N-acetyltransferase n=1 Tax=Lederbergia citrisecunda TaxID=2833583 RepID=A0A942TKP9_9BACI|nr:GNAT family N-acetyltransferase [Lederbergia citrisecunda]MBS4199238.1 GNAT family N-acetyltransferase [Lederbergia citrisecunda]